jgi:SagB-type dehydrogenase family enzyme
MIDYYHLSLHPHVDVEFKHGEVILYHPKLKLVFDSKIMPFDKLFCLLKSPGGNIDFFIKTFSSSIDKISIYYVLQQLAKHGLLSFSLLDTEFNTIIILEPMSTNLEFFDNYSQIINNELVLSRFSYIRKKNKMLILESPLGNCIIYLSDPRSVMFINLLTTPSSFNFLLKSTSFFKSEQLLAFLNLLIIAKAITNVELEDSSEDLMQWDFHDLLFHSRSRMGRHHYSSGKTFRFKGRIEPTPALKTWHAGKITVLPMPKEQSFLKKESLQISLEKRRSIRSYGKKSITLEQLSEFLYRSARVKKSYDMNDNSPYQTTLRPYPNAGACYELELYICLQRGDAIEAGLYHYHPKQHILELISTDESSINELAAQANRAIGKNNFLDVLIIITARFGRVNWQYESIAYSLILKNVGVIYQTFYLIATEMGLAPCALGSGDSDLFARIAGLNYFEETSVGEFLLGIESVK